MLRKICGLLLWGAIALSAATNVALSGTVNDEGDEAVADAIVSLKSHPEIKATTDASGAFSITGSITGVAVPYAVSIRESSPVTGKGKFVQFSVVVPVSQASVSFFSSSGRKVAFLPVGRLEAGKHTVALPVLSPGFYLMLMTLDKVTTTSKLVNTGGGTYISGSEIAEGHTPGRVRGAASAYIDTLVATKEGYTAAKVGIDTYTKSGIVLVLKKSGTPVECPEIKLPAPSAITYSNKKHPGPWDFKFMDLPRVTTKAQWECRRQEIWLMSQEYLYGHLPPKCEVTGTVSGGTITANCTYNGKTVKVSLNASGSGDILMIDFGAGAPKPSNARSATASGATFLSNAKSLYGSTDMGICMASAWGVGRIIDALEQNPDCGISAKKVVVTGCSTCGKQAMGAGVFEPRVALCVPVESGCAGTCSWRVSSEYGHGNTNTDCQDITHLETNWTGTVTDNSWEKGNPTIDHLPFDQGELMALRAPGALLQVDNGKEQYKWLCNRGNTAAAQGCRWIYKALGIEDNFGYIQPDPGHGHCSWPSSLTPDLTKFYDKFLNGKSDVNTHVFTYNKESAETSKWFDFGTGEDQWDTTLVLQ